MVLEFEKNEVEPKSKKVQKLEELHNTHLNSVILPLLVEML
jgi:hypothetical protein